MTVDLSPEGRAHNTSLFQTSTNTTQSPYHVTASPLISSLTDPQEEAASKQLAYGYQRLAMTLYHTAEHAHSALLNLTSLNVNASVGENLTSPTTTADWAGTGRDILEDRAYQAIRDVQKVFIPILCLCGFVGNLTSVGIFMERTLKNKSCCMYLMTKCLTDTLFLVALFVVWLDRVCVPWFHQHGVCQMIVFITYVCGFLSVWLVVMVTVENYIRICHPHRVHALCTPGKARVVLLSLGLVAIFCYNFPLWTTHSLTKENSSRCSLIPEFSRFNEGLTYFDTAVTLVLPTLLVAVLMCGIFGALVAAYRRNKRMKKLGRQRHIHFFCLSPYGRVTAMLLAVSITFIALHTPSHAIRLRLLIGSLLKQNPAHFVVELRLQRLFELLYYSNYVTNCVTYFVFGKAFRDLYKQLYCSYCCKLKVAKRSNLDLEGLDNAQHACNNAPAGIETEEGRATTDFETILRNNDESDSV